MERLRLLNVLRKLFSLKYQLNLQSPCQEAWGNMAPSEDGRFCGSCKKVVVDFSAMSDQQIIDWFKSKSMVGKELCFNVAPSQLNRAISPVRKLIRTPKYVWSILASTLLSLTTKAQGGSDVEVLVPTEIVEWNEFRTDTVKPGTGEIFSPESGENFDLIRTNLRTGECEREEWRWRGTGRFVRHYYDFSAVSDPDLITLVKRFFRLFKRKSR